MTRAASIEALLRLQDEPDWNREFMARGGYTRTYQGIPEKQNILRRELPNRYVNIRIVARDDR